MLAALLAAYAVVRRLLAALLRMPIHARMRPGADVGVRSREKSEFHNVVAWDRLAETCGRYLGKGQQVAIEGRIQTRTWDDDQGKRHWKTEIVASSVEMLSGRRKKDYAAETAATALEAQAVAAGVAPDAGEPIADDAGFSVTPGGDEDDEEDELLEEAVAA